MLQTGAGSVDKMCGLELALCVCVHLQGEYQCAELVCAWGGNKVKWLFLVPTKVSVCMYV